MINERWDDNQEIKCHVGKAKSIINKMSAILKRHSLSFETKIRHPSQQNYVLKLFLKYYLQFIKCFKNISISTKYILKMFLKHFLLPSRVLKKILAIF